MTGYKPKTPFNVPALLQAPGSKIIKGAKKKVFPGIREGELIFISFRTFGGTEKVSNGQLVVENTAVVETWFRPDIKSDCRIVVDGVPYKILGTPENINKSNQYLVFKVRAVKGGA